MHIEFTLNINFDDKYIFLDKIIENFNYFIWKKIDKRLTK